MLSSIAQTMVLSMQKKGKEFFAQEMIIATKMLLMTIMASQYARTEDRPNVAMEMSLVTMVMTIGVAMVASIAQMMVLNMRKKMGASFAQELMQLLVVIN